MDRILLVAVVWSCAACAGTSTQTRVTVTEEARVENCNPVGTVEEAIDSPTDNPDLKDAVVDGLKQRARTLGATHIVYVKREIEPRYVKMSALAYSCDD